MSKNTDLRHRRKVSQDPTKASKSDNDKVNKRFESYKRDKLVAIYQALRSDLVDVAVLRKFAISKGGLLTDEIRREVWPKLLNVNMFDTLQNGVNFKEHRDDDQVVLDVNQSLKRIPPDSNVIFNTPVAKNSFSMESPVVAIKLIKYEPLNLRKVIRSAHS